MSPGTSLMQPASDLRSDGGSIVSVVCRIVLFGSLATTCPPPRGLRAGSCWVRDGAGRGLDRQVKWM